MIHNGNANEIVGEAVSDTPTTGVAQATPEGELRRQILSQCVAKNEREWWAAGMIEKLEFELNAANDRIKRLEEAGDAMMSEPCEYTFEQWIKAKEAKP